MKPLKTRLQIKHLEKMDFSKVSMAKDELYKVNDKFKMLGTPVGKVMLGKADILEMSKRSGMDVQEIIGKITVLIDSHN